MKFSSHQQQLEGLISWKRVSFCLLALVSIQAVFLSTPWIKSSRDASPNFDVSSPNREAEQSATLRTTGAALTASQCATHFPDLYHEVDRATGYWKKQLRRTISSEDVDISWRNDGALRILIHQNELRILQTKGVWSNSYRERALSVLSQLQEALWSASAAGEILPTIEAAIVVDDMSLIPTKQGDTHSIWTFTSTDRDPAHQRHWLIPGFSFYSAPGTGSFIDAQRRALQHDSPIVDKVQQAIWRGVRWTNPDVRGPLLDSTVNKTWADVKEVNWETKENLMDMEDMCKFAYVIHTEGRSYSGRLQFLLNCDAATIIHKLDWRCHYYHLLVPKGPKQNYIPVESHFGDLEKTMDWYLEHPEESQKIANNSIATFRSKYFTPAATSCYLRRLIKGYGEVAFTPEVLRPEKRGEARKRRGMSFAEIVHLREEYEGDEV
ncbi:unnamed protein product [Zymoseptoria tritici ST99CH_1A5]|nr:unnamed protein product [Zymoseptoria tritici ST99CH_1A5]